MTSIPVVNLRLENISLDEAGYIPKKNYS